MSKHDDRLAATMDYAEGRTGGKEWNWHDGLIAQLAVVEHRQLQDAEQQAKRDAEEFRAVWRYVARKGLLGFNIAFLQELYFQWRFGVLIDETDEPHLPTTPQAPRRALS